MVNRPQFTNKDHTNFRYEFKAAVGNFEEREDLASNLKKYNFQIPPSPLHSFPASKVPPPEEADVRTTARTHGCARDQ